MNLTVRNLNYLCYGLRTLISLARLVGTGRVRLYQDWHILERSSAQYVK